VITPLGASDQCRNAINTRSHNDVVADPTDGGYMHRHCEMAVHNDAKVLHCVHGCNGQRQNRNFMFDDVLHLLTKFGTLHPKNCHGIKPDEDCLCRIQT